MSSMSVGVTATEIGMPSVSTWKHRCSMLRQEACRCRRYCRRWKIERLLAWLGNFRRLVMRHERHALKCLGFVHLGCIRIVLRQDV